MEGANSTEFDPETPFPVIDLLPEQKEIADMGGTMRLGADPIKLHDGDARSASCTARRSSTSATATATRSTTTCAGGSSRPGLVCSGTSPDERLVEAIELPADEHPFFVASQYHPEFKSRPERPAPAVPRSSSAPRSRTRSRRTRRGADEGSERDGRHAPPREARQRGRARAAGRDVRGAVPDREPVRARAPLRRLGRRASSTAIGLEVDEDDAGAAAGSDAATCWRGFRDSGADSILLCAHLDTVPLAAPVEPVIVDGGWENANEAILGADNKAAVAVVLELARRLHGRAGSRPRWASSCCSPSARRSRSGAPRRSTPTRLSSRFGYVFDHASPIGEIVLASPTYYRIVAEVRGRAAHAGIRPEDGRSAIAAAARAIAAMRLGRLDPETTANVGTIAGGTNANVVPEHCRIEAEARSLDRVARRGGGDRDGRPPAGGRRRGRVRPRRDRRADVRGLPDPAARTAGGARRARAARLRLRAPATSPRGGGSDANALEAQDSRARTSPTAPSATTSPGSGSASTRSRGCSRSRSRCVEQAPAIVSAAAATA